MTDTAAREDARELGVTERERWVAERAFRDREIAAREREVHSREVELDMKREEQARARWHNPLVVAIFAAAVAAGGNAVASLVNGTSERRLEATRSEQARILEMIKTGDPDKAAQNLSFLLDAGLITEPDMERRLRASLASRKPGAGPVLPSPAAAKLQPPIVENARVYLLAGTKAKASQLSGLREDLAVAGFAVLGARHLLDEGRSDPPEVRYFNDSDREQAERLAEFVRFKLHVESLEARRYRDPAARPGYVEVWVGR